MIKQKEFEFDPNKPNHTSYYRSDLVYKRKKMIEDTISNYLQEIDENAPFKRDTVKNNEYEPINLSERIHKSYI